MWVIETVAVWSTLNDRKARRVLSTQAPVEGVSEALQSHLQTVARLMLTEWQGHYRSLAVTVEILPLQTPSTL